VSASNDARTLGIDGTTRRGGYKAGTAGGEELTPRERATAERQIRQLELWCARAERAFQQEVGKSRLVMALSRHS